MPIAAFTIGVITGILGSSTALLLLGEARVAKDFPDFFPVQHVGAWRGYLALIGCLIGFIGGAVAIERPRTASTLLAAAGLLNLVAATFGQAIAGTLFITGSFMADPNLGAQVAGLVRSLNSSTRPLGVSKGAVQFVLGCMALASVIWAAFRIGIAR